MSEVTNSAPNSASVKTWKHGPIPEFGGACFYVEAKANASLKDLTAKKKQMWIKIEGAVIYVHLSKFSKPLHAIGINDMELEMPTTPKCLIVRSPEKAIYLEVDNDATFAELKFHLSKAVAWKFDMFYGIFNVLGKGTFATVHGGYDKETSEQVAIKILRKKEFRPAEIKLLVSEYEAAKRLNHPNIMKVLDIFNTEATLTIVNELMGGGSVADFLYKSEEKSLQENVVKEIILEVILGVRYLHDVGIVHRDIKPDNLMMKSRRFPYETKIIDFGFCKWYDQSKYWDNPMEGYIGTRAFAAPELLANASYTPQVDLYAAGISTWNCLTGEVPYHAKDHDAIRSLIFKGLPFPKDKFSDKSKECISFIKSLCNVNPYKRLSADAAFVHPWFDRSQVKKRQKQGNKSPTAALTALLFIIVFSKKLVHVLEEEQHCIEDAMSSLLEEATEKIEKKGSFLRSSGSSKVRSASSFQKRDDSTSSGGSFRKFLTESGSRVKKNLSGKFKTPSDS